ncbi:MAG: hypothetical protein AAF533_09375 [Acidobacteriota bacterium]
MIDRAALIDCLRVATEPEDFINAAWLGGSTAMGTEDALSDVDIQFDVMDGRVDEAFAVVEKALAELAPIDVRWVLPAKTWHGHAQRVYRLEGTPEHLMIDMVIMERDTDAPRFNEREIHGEPVILFDKLGVIAAVPLAWDAHREKMRAALEQLEPRVKLLTHFPAKECERGLAVDALFRYHGFVITPLIQVLRTRHCPERFDFGARYLKRDLPAEVFERLQELCFVADAEALREKAAEARSWLEEELELARQELAA